MLAPSAFRLVLSLYLMLYDLASYGTSTTAMWVRRSRRPDTSPGRTGVITQPSWLPARMIDLSTSCADADLPDVTTGWSLTFMIGRFVHAATNASTSDKASA